MKQIRAKHTVTAIADRLKRAEKLPALRAVCAQADFRKTEMNQQNISLLKRGSQARTIKTHIADLPPDVQNLLAEEFEQRVIAFREKLEVEYAEIKRDRNELAVLNERQSAEIESLKSAIKYASAKIEFLTVALINARAKMAERAGLIGQLKNEIAVGHDPRQRRNSASVDARQGLTKVERKLEDTFPELSGGV